MPYFDQCVCYDEGMDEYLNFAKRDDGPKPYKITVQNWYVFGRIGDMPMQKHKLQWKITE